MAILFGGIPLLIALAVAIGLNVSARNLEKRLSSLVEDQLDCVRRIEQALTQVKGEKQQG